MKNGGELSHQQFLNAHLISFQDSQVCHVTPCRLQDTLASYLQELPQYVDVEIDTAVATNAFALDHLQVYLAEEALREEQKGNAEYKFAWYDEDGSLIAPNKTWQ